ncbi:glycosyltransferase family 4 protein [Bacillus salitolerans]|uniref:Glycosyltransferase family 4 protein n=1 Tax=Bacillus salitolerans TaxID=1437434 RepID=A0ABW4LMV2_9BACI
MKTEFYQTERRVCMHICLVNEEYPKETSFGGIATYQHILARELVKRGNRVTVICKSNVRSQRYIEEGVEVVRIFSKDLNNIDSLINYRMKVKEELENLEKQGLDIIETPEWGADTIFYLSKGKVPIVTKLHTPLKVWLKYNKSHMSLEIKEQLLKWEEELINRSEKVISCTESLKNIVLREMDITRNDDIEIIPNPAILNELGMKKIKSYNQILFCGSLEERKGVLNLARVLPSIFKKHSNYKVVFIGKDTNRNNLNISTQELIKSYVGEEYVDFLEFKGHINNNIIQEEYAKSAVCVFPSLYENFPYVVLEAMSNGAAIIGSINGGMTEMINDGVSGLLIDPYNLQALEKAILNVIEDSECSEIMRNNARREVERFSSSKIVEQNLRVYQEAIQERRGKIEQRVLA